MIKPTLRELQEWMRWVVTDPRGVKEALKAPHPEDLGLRYQSPKGDFRHLIQGKDQDERETRLSVHAEGYFARLLDALKADFPATAKVLGSEQFQSLIHDFLKEHPSKYFSINEAGRELPLFATENVETPVWLGELTQLEWLMVEAFYSPSTKAFDFSRLTGQSELWAEATFSFAPCVRLLTTQYAVDEIRAERANPKSMTSLPEPVTLLVYRLPNGFAANERLSLAEAQCFQALLQGRTLSEALERLPEATGDAASWFQRWAGLSLISNVVFPLQSD